MSDLSTFKRFVELGHAALLKSGPSAGKIAVIVEIIDHNPTDVRSDEKGDADADAAAVWRRSSSRITLAKTSQALETVKKKKKGGGDDRDLEAVDVAW
jgi:hypothetical protein